LEEHQLIRVEQLSRRYGNFTAVDQVSFAIEGSAIIGLLGHNGAGKTTIMKMLSGYLEPSAGQVIYGGRRVADDPTWIQRDLGYLPESLPVYPEMSVADYLDFAASMRGLGGADRDRAVARAIVETELEPKALAPIGTLSRGYKQRVGVAQAILHRPKVLILDEPTNGLDPEQTLHMRALIRRLGEDATVLLSTHIMQEVDAVCDRALILRAGRLLLDESLVTLRQTRALLLATSAPAAAIASLVQGDTAIATHQLEQEQGERYTYRLQLQSDADFDRTTAALIGALVQRQFAVYSAVAVQRDLETVFREVNAGEGLAHAA
jgi:ABC-2 type transport system ATP-binding protein